MEVIKGYKRKLVLTPEIAQKSQNYAGQCRLVYNLALQQRNLAYSICRKSLNYYDQEKELKELKEAFPFLKQAPSQILQQSLKDLQTAFDRFFEGTSGYPSPRRKFVNDSFRFPEPKKFNIRKLTKRKGAITLPKLGELRFLEDIKHSIPKDAKPRSATIKKEAGVWYISINCLVDIAEPSNISTENASSAVGLDRGCNNLLATSIPLFTYEQADNASKDSEETLAQLGHLLKITNTPKLLSEFHGSLISLRDDVLERYGNRIIEYQRILALKKKGSIAFKLLKSKISRLHRKLRNYRLDVLHQLSTWIVKNQDIIFVEKLDVKKMTKSNKGTSENPGTDVAKKSALNKFILQQGWGYLRTFLKYKSKWLGKLFDDEVNPAYTSLKCYECKHISSLNRQDEMFLCQRCHHTDHADVNAAKNILRDGLSRIASEFEQLKLLEPLGTIALSSSNLGSRL